MPAIALRVAAARERLTGLWDRAKELVKKPSSSVPYFLGGVECDGQPLETVFLEKAMRDMRIIARVYLKLMSPLNRKADPVLEESESFGVRIAVSANESLGAYYEHVQKVLAQEKRRLERTPGLFESIRLNRSIQKAGKMRADIIACGPHLYDICMVLAGEKKAPVDVMGFSHFSIAGLEAKTGVLAKARVLRPRELAPAVFDA